MTKEQVEKTTVGASIGNDISGSSKSAEQESTGNEKVSKMSIETTSSAATSTTATVQPRPRRYTRDPPVTDSLFVGGSTKVHMGKMEPCRDLGLPAFVLVMGLCMAYSMSGMWGNNGNDKKSHKSWDQQFKDHVARKLKLDFDLRGGNTAENCTLFYAKSSVPGAGYGVFAGQSYQVGDVVLPKGDFLPTSLHTGPESDHEILMIQQHSYLLKFHHLLHNLEGRSYYIKNVNPVVDDVESSHSMVGHEYVLRASKPIQPGDELLLPFHLHPKSHPLLEDSNYFESIPTPEDYDLAETIIQDEIHRFRFVRGHHQPKGMDIDRTLDLLYRTVYRFNPRVARMLPTKKKVLDDWGKFYDHTTTIATKKHKKKTVPKEEPRPPFAIEVIEKKSYAGLEMNAMCFSNAAAVTPPHDSSRPAPIHTSNGGMVATQDFKKGRTVLPVPVLLLNLEGTTSQSCQSRADTESEQCIPQRGLASEWSTSECFGHQDLPFLLCPLASVDLFRCVLGPTVACNGREETSSRDDLGARTLDLAVGNSGGAPNVRLQWVEGHSANTQSQKLSSEEIAHHYGTKLILELVSTREIQAGDKLVIDLGPEEKEEEEEEEEYQGATPTYIPLPHDILPDAWKNTK